MCDVAKDQFRHNNRQLTLNSNKGSDFFEGSCSFEVVKKCEIFEWRKRQLSTRGWYQYRVSAFPLKYQVSGICNHIECISLWKAEQGIGLVSDTC